MAQRHGKMNGITIRQRYTPAILAFMVIVALVLAGFFPVLLIGAKAGLAVGDPYLFHVAGFTLWQAGLSTVLSLALAIPVARALARRRFPGRGIIIRLLALPLALPAIVTVLGIVEVYGNQGWLGGLFDIYGLPGILLAHVFFNFSLGARLLLSRLAAVPPESWRLAAQLGFRDRHVWARIEWPHIWAVLPGIAILIFLLCTASFAVVLTLGGGPQATTLEVAIYQALRFDFDPARAVGLALVQLFICSVLVLLAHRFGGQMRAWQSFRSLSSRYDGTSLLARLADGLAIAMGLAVLIPPIAAVVLSGMAHVELGGDVAAATATSLAIGVCSASLSVMLTWPLAQAAARRQGWSRLSSLAVVAGLVMPPAVLATGWFLLLTRFSTFAVPAPVLVIAMSTLMALPFVYNALAAAIAASARQNDRLCASLGISGVARFLRIDLPSLRRPLGFSFLMAAIVSL
ncbi:MAG: thiamine/thiamine pyrophosphate ABC transporter permease ThiP, partial [Rhizobiales bacterium]|nr:thiamine/thiamine pyrophosphate ABC transporter permease ThiP [Hyphomicrobiales bacterium]